MRPDQVIRDFKWGFAGLSAGSSPPRLHPRGHRLLGSPHERLGGRAVHPARLPSHVPALGSPLDFHQTHGQGLVLSLVTVGVSIPEEERLVDARGEGDPQHLPGLRGYQPPSCDYILPHTGRYVNTFFEKNKKIFECGPARKSHPDGWLVTPLVSPLPRIPFGAWQTRLSCAVAPINPHPHGALLPAYPSLAATSRIAFRFTARVSHRDLLTLATVSLGDHPPSMVLLYHGLFRLSRVFEDFLRDPQLVTREFCSQEGSYASTRRPLARLSAERPSEGLGSASPPDTDIISPL